MTDSNASDFNSKLRISVALCSYNGNLFIEEQIISILEQTLAIDEIIISDDGSTDGTIEKISRLINQRNIATPVIKIIQGERLGITRNFNRALKACSGDIIFLSDQDDIWLPNKVSVMLAVLQANPDALLAFSNAHLVDEHLNKLDSTQFQIARLNAGLLQQLQGKNAFFPLLRRNVVTGATVALRRQLLDIADPFVDGWLHDEWLAILAAAFAPLAIVEQPLVLYRQHSNNQCGMKPSSVKTKISESKNSALQSSGEKRITNLLSRLGQFRDHLNNRDILHYAQDYLVFESKRKQFHPSRYKRFPQVFILIIKNQYSRYSDGWRSAIKDILAK